MSAGYIYAPYVPMYTSTPYSIGERKVTSKANYFIASEILYVKSVKSVEVCLILDDGYLSGEVNKPGCKPYFLINCGISGNSKWEFNGYFVTDGSIWYNASPESIGWIEVALTTADREFILDEIEKLIKPDPSHGNSEEV